MKRRTSSCIYISLIITLFIAGDVFAGGRCGGGGGGRRGAAELESPLEKKQRLAKKYAFGQRIMEGRVKLRPAVPQLVRQQENMLAPFKELAAHEKIEEVSGRLSRDELDAVQYYLTTKYIGDAEAEQEKQRKERWRNEKALLGP